jgi:transcriptional regulator GlxA family with amidase domain
MRIAICIGRHTNAASVVNILDVVHSANRHQGETLFETLIVSDCAKPQNWQGISLQPQATLRAASNCDLVLVPAFGGELDNVAADQARLLRFLPLWAARGQRLGSACAGAFMLARSGVLDGYRATTHCGLLEDARRLFPAVLWQQGTVLERDGGRLTSSGGTATIDLALALVEERGGLALARSVADSMLFDHRRGAQNLYFPLAPVPLGDDPLVRDVQKCFATSLAAPPTMVTLAASLHVTPRTLLRRFKRSTGVTLQNYVQRLRLDMARQLLDDSPKSVEQAMAAVGYVDRASFSRRFKHYYGISPGAYRQRRGISGN